MSTNPQHLRPANDPPGDWVDPVLDPGWMLRDIAPGGYPVTAQIVALEDSLLELEEAVARLWRVMTNAGMPCPAKPLG